MVDPTVIAAEVPPSIFGSGYAETCTSVVGPIALPYATASAPCATAANGNWLSRLVAAFTTLETTGCAKTGTDNAPRQTTSLPTQAVMLGMLGEGVAETNHRDLKNGRRLWQVTRSPAPQAEAACEALKAALAAQGIEQGIDQQIRDVTGRFLHRSFEAIERGSELLPA